MRRVLVDLSPLRSYSGMTGIGRYIFELACGLADTQDEWRGSLDIVAVGGLPWLPRWQFDSNLRRAATEALALRGTEADGLVARRRVWLSAAAHAAHADLLHVTEALGTPIGGLVPRLVTCYDLIPLVMRTAYLGSGIKGRLRFAQQLSRDLVRYRGARRIVAISERTRADVVNIIGVAPNRIEAIPTRIDLLRFTTAAPAGTDQRILRAHRLESKPYALYVGSGDPRKNAEGMCAALGMAARSVDLELAWAGVPSAKERERAMRAARRHGVTDRLRWLGFVPDDELPALYRGAACHLFISRLEGFGLTVVEAMAAGCPVIVARNSGSDELVGDAGIIVAPDDAASVAEHLVHLATDPARRAHHARRGRALVRHFDRRHMARGYVAAYERALRGS